MSSLKRCKPSFKKLLSENMKMNFICTLYLRAVFNDFKSMGIDCCSVGNTAF